MPNIMKQFRGGCVAIRVDDNSQESLADLDASVMDEVLRLSRAGIYVEAIVQPHDGGAVAAIRPIGEAGSNRRQLEITGEAAPRGMKLLEEESADNIVSSMSAKRYDTADTDRSDLRKKTNGRRK